MLPHRWADAAGQGSALVLYTWLACSIPSGHLLTCFGLFSSPSIAKLKVVTQSNLSFTVSSLFESGSLIRVKFAIFTSL